MGKNRNHQPCLEVGCFQMGTQPDYSRCDTHKKQAYRNTNRSKRLPKDWKLIRQQVFRRDNFECQTCGQFATEVDHIERGDNHHISNLQSLCKQCHHNKTVIEARQELEGMKPMPFGNSWMEQYNKRKR